MYNVNNEWMKLIRKRSTIALLVITFLFPLLVGPAINVLQSKFGFTAFDGGSFPLAILNLAVSFYLPLLIALTVSDMFAGEQEQKTASFFLVRPLTRFKIFSSKIICFGIYLLALLLIICVTSILTGAIWFENFTFNSFLQGIGAYLLSWFPLMALGLLLVLLVQWFGSSSRAITFSILLYIVTVVLSYLFPMIGQFLPAYDNDWYERWLYSGMNLVLMGRTIFLLSFCIMFFTLGFYKFNKKEF